MPNILFIMQSIIRFMCELVTYVSLFFCFTASADIIVVTRIDSELDSASIQQLRSLWLKQSIYIGETAVEIIDLPENDPARKQFYNQIVGKTGNKLSAYWAKQVFRGNNFPPATGSSETAVIDWLKDAKNRLAYISDESFDENLKTIYRLTESRVNQNNEN